jgi:arginase family enzyme
MKPAPPNTVIGPAIIEEQCIVTSLSYHIGIRGTTYVQGVFEQTKSLGYNIISLRELFARGFADVLTELYEKLKGRPVYLCFDIEFLRGLSGLDIIAVDVNTVSPPHDVQNMTAFLAAQVIYESLGSEVRSRASSERIGESLNVERFRDRAVAGAGGSHTETLSPLRRA